MVSGRKLGEDSSSKNDWRAQVCRGAFFIPRVRALPGRGPKSSKKAPPKRGTSSLQNEENVLPGLGVVPIVNVFSDLILSEAVALLNFALKLVSLTIDRGKVVVSEVSPLLLDLALYLLPVALDAISVHV